MLGDHGALQQRRPDHTAKRRPAATAGALGAGHYVWESALATMLPPLPLGLRNLCSLSSKRSRLRFEHAAQ